MIKVKLAIYFLDLKSLEKSLAQLASLVFHSSHEQLTS